MPSDAYKKLEAMLRKRPDVIDAPVQAWRDQVDKTPTLFTFPEDVAREAVDAGGIDGEWLTPQHCDPERIVLYLHGGGYCVGSIASHRHLAALTARAANARALIVSYRLAPENPFPMGIEDALAVYRWLLAENHAPDRLAVAGDSAGAGLALAMLLNLRDVGESLPIAAVLNCPWTDLMMSGSSVPGEGAVDASLTQRAVLKRLADWYLDGHTPEDPLASPLFAQLHGLPPLYIAAGTADALYADATRLADRAREAGVEVELEIGEGMMHVWPYYAPIIPEGMASVERMGAFLQRHLR